MNNNSIVSDSYNGLSISTRKSDGWINLTQICQSTGKRLGHFLELKSTKEYFAQIERDTGKDIGDFITITKGGEPSSQGTWACIEIADRLIGWLKHNEARTSNKKSYGVIYVYHDKNNNAYKIGFTVDLLSREKQHKTSNPFLVLVAEYPVPSIEVEKVIHDSLAKYRIPKTTEWYISDQAVLTIVKRIVKEYA